MAKFTHIPIFTSRLFSEGVGKMTDVTVSAEMLIELLQQRIYAMERERRHQDKKAAYYIKELAKELGSPKNNLPSTADYHSIRILLGQVREKHNKPFFMEDDKYGEDES